LAGAEQILQSPSPAAALKQLFPHLYREGVTDDEVRQGAMQVKQQAMMKLGQVPEQGPQLNSIGLPNGGTALTYGNSLQVMQPPKPDEPSWREKIDYETDASIRKTNATRQPEKPAPTYRPMTPEEIKAAGLGDGTAAQKRDSDGHVQVLSQPKQAAGGVTPDQAWNVWQTARKGLVDALSKTNTGPIAGRVLKYTSGGQVAKGGVAAVAPIMKDLFRKAGEGTFTEGDQKLLMDMLPTETTDEDAREAILKNIDNIISAKLGIPPAAGGDKPPVQVRSLQEARGLPKGTVFVTPDGKRKVR
jgi:hypothetical protein